MTRPRIGHLLVKLDRLLDRYVVGKPDYSLFRDHRAFVWDGARQAVKPVMRPVRIDPDSLIGIEQARQSVIANTRHFVEGGMANNVLLWGERGTGKSSLIKSLLTLFANTRLRLIQVYKHDILTVQDLYGPIADDREHRFILFIDDLSFEEGQTDYKEMKTIMDGGVEEIPGNILFYATSNRKHLVPTKFTDNDVDDIRPSDTVEEKVSLADRFGLRCGFYHISQDTYLEIAAFYAERYHVRMDRETLDRMALQWALAAGGRNGRIAEQFARAAQAGTAV